MSEALGIKALLNFVGFTVAIRCHCDSSAARALARRLWRGRIKHLATNTMWTQTLHNAKLIEIVAVPGEENRADLGTKAMSRMRVEMFREACGIVPMPTLNARAVEANILEGGCATERGALKQPLRALLRLL